MIFKATNKLTKELKAIPKEIFKKMLPLRRAIFIFLHISLNQFTKKTQINSSAN